MSEGGRNLLVGIVSIGALVGFVAMMLLFGELDRFVLKRYVITIHTDHASGLRRGSSVELNGVPIGVVDNIGVEANETHMNGPFTVQLTALIDRDIAIPDSAVPYAASSLLGGAATLEIGSGPHEDSPSFLSKDGTAQINGPMRIRILEQITTELDARMAPLMTALEEFETLSATYTELGRSINDLLQPQSDDALAGGAAANLRTAISRLDEVLVTTKDALSLARDWLGDDELRTDARSSARKASALIDQAAETLDRFTRMAGSLEGDAKALTERLLPVADELALTLEDVRRLTRMATEGEGTVPLLLRNPDLYRSLDDAAIRLEASLREIQLFIQKVKAEGLPIQF